ncbi:sulfatase-like hydrolase/transferase [uncultured Gimesia sp.]|uniref:sulfatase family protein n=1 Tax=uncultured Gimesia sp. TaxID=1678688 RepID=UPI0030D9337C|tara:strand:- start:35542 stop:36960 length:1419 start_codon:yes stop_codon:yes gene_type:complete
MFPKFIIVLVCLLGCLFSFDAHAAEKPNVILIMCDDLGWGDTGFNGNKIIRTPHLDAMARAGMNLKRFYAGAPVCSPTRGSCLTGRNPFRYGIVHANTGHMKPQEQTLAESLKTVGYRTGHFGKWHLGTLTKTTRDSNRGGPKNSDHFSPPWQNGFEVCFSTEAKVPTWDPMRKPKGKASGKGWAALTEESPSQPYGTHYWNAVGEIVNDNLRGDDSRVIMDRAVPFIKQSVQEKQPFFCVIWFHTPHLPVVAGPDYRKLYAKYDLNHANYFGCITAMDEQVGRLRAQLKSLAVAKNTMLWFCSDNGPEGKASAPGSAGPFRGRKRDLTEGGIRVPALLEWPGNIQPGTETRFPMVTSDYLPTILAAAGLMIPEDRPLDGINLLPVLEQNLQERRQPIGFQFQNNAAWMTQQYKLLRTRKRGNDQYQLFDLLADPGETTDVSETHPELVKQYQTELERWIKSCANSNQGRDY